MRRVTRLCYTVNRSISMTLFAITLIHGCAGGYKGDQKFTVTLNSDEAIEGGVVLIEVLDAKLMPDAGRHSESYRLKSAELRFFEGDRVVIESPHLFTAFVFPVHMQQHYRWTFIVPGRVIATVYPYGQADVDDDGQVTYFPTIGWCSSSGQVMRPWSWRITPGFEKADRAIDLHIPLRRLSTDWAIPFSTNRPHYEIGVPPQLIYVDAWNFNDQMRSLARAMKHRATGYNDPEIRQLLDTTVSQEHETLLKAGYVEQINALVLKEWDNSRRSVMR